MMNAHARAAVVACMMQAIACSDPVSHVLVGRLYVEARRCLGTSSSVDVVSGGDPGACAPACLVQKTLDGGRSLYVTTTCPPYPPDFDATGREPACAAALDALSRDDTCLADGGSTHPPTPPADAGADAP